MPDIRREYGRGNRASSVLLRYCSFVYNSRSFKRLSEPKVGRLEAFQGIYTRYSGVERCSPSLKIMLYIFPYCFEPLAILYPIRWANFLNFTDVGLQVRGKKHIACLIFFSLFLFIYFHTKKFIKIIIMTLQFNSS